MQKTITNTKWRCTIHETWHIQHDIPKYWMFDVSLSYSPGCEGGVACVGGGGGVVEECLQCRGWEVAQRSWSHLPSLPLASPPPATSFVIVTTIRTTLPISAFRLMNVGTFLWYTDPTQSFHLCCNFYITSKRAVARPEIMSSAVLNVLWKPRM